MGGGVKIFCHLAEGVIVFEGRGGRASGQAINGVRNVRPGAKDVDEHAE